MHPTSNLFQKALTLIILVTSKQVLMQTVKNQMKSLIRRHFSYRNRIKFINPEFTKWTNQCLLYQFVWEWNDKGYGIPSDLNLDQAKLLVNCFFILYIAVNNLSVTSGWVSLG